MLLRSIQFRTDMGTRVRPDKLTFAALVLGLAFSKAGWAYDPELGTTISAFPILQAGGHPYQWDSRDPSYRILIIGTSWCPPCQDLKAALPFEIARLRKSGIAVSTVFVEADGFGRGSVVTRGAGPNSWGYFDAVPDPARIDLANESPKGIRNWGVFRAHGFPTTVLLNERNVVIGRYRGSNSISAFDDVIAYAQKNGALGKGPGQPAVLPAAPVVGAKGEIQPNERRATDDVVDRAGDELIGLWKINNLEARDPRPLFLRVIGVTSSGPGPLLLEASLSFKLTKWVPVAARCEQTAASCVLHLTTVKGGQMTARRQPNGSYSGDIAYGRTRTLVRPFTMVPMSLDEADL